MLKNIISTIVLAAAAVVPAGAAVINYSYYHGTEETGVWGTGKAETYNVCILVNDPSLVGKKVTAITVPVNPEATLSNCKAFLTKGLNGLGSSASFDIASVDFTPADSLTKVTLTEPYIIEGAFYAGVSLKVAKATTENDKNPILLAAGEEAVANALFLSSSRTYKKWSTPASLEGLILPVSVEIEGDFPADALGVMSLPKSMVKVGTPSTINVAVVNHGTSTVKNIDYKYEIAGQTVEKHLDLEKEISGEFFGTTGEIAVEVPAIDQLGTYTGTLTITKLNGLDNGDSAASATSSVRVMEEVPVLRVVEEEYTGTWCGWCPRGWMGMEILNEEFPDNYVALSYHNGDVMQFTDVYPTEVTGFPHAVLNRKMEVDPYFGTSSGTPMGIAQDVKKLLQNEIPANIKVEATLSDDCSKIDATATVTFLGDYEENPYRLSYAVTADGLNRKGCSKPDDPTYAALWAQHSYFVGETGYGPEMDMFVNGQEYMFLDFNDVVIGTAPYKGVTDALPASATDLQTVDHSYSFNTADMVSIYEECPGEKLIQDYNKLNIVALLLDSRTNEIVNAGKAKVANPSGLGSVVADYGTIVATEYFDLSGRRLENPAQGICIARDRYDNGAVRSRKILVK